MTGCAVFAVLSIVFCLIAANGQSQWFEAFADVGRDGDATGLFSEDSERKALATCLSGEQFLCALISRLKSGESLAGALDGMDGAARGGNPVGSSGRLTRCLQAGCRPAVLREEISAAVGRVCASEGDEDRAFLGASIGVCAILCNRLGCSALGLMEAVRKLYTQRRTHAELVSNAFAMPKATVKVLAALPLIIDGGGMVFGAHPLRFLLFSSAGRLCCLAGFFLLCIGILWTKRLLQAQGSSNARAELPPTGEVNLAILPQFCFFLELVAAAINHGAAVPDALLACVDACRLEGDFSQPLQSDVNYFYLRNHVLRYRYQKKNSPNDYLDATGLSAVAIAAQALLHGTDWADAWDGALEPFKRRRKTALISYVRRLQQALEPMWTYGAEGVERLSALADELVEEESSNIRTAASSLTVRLLLPLGLCFLPMFIVLAVVPIIASFAVSL